MLRHQFRLINLGIALITAIHRAAIGKGKLREAIDLTRDILGVPADYRIGIVPASDTGAVSPDQPFYRIFALGEDGGFVAYAAESVLEDGRSALLTDEVRRWFTVDGQGHHAPLHAGIH